MNYNLFLHLEILISSLHNSLTQKNYEKKNLIPLQITL